MSQITTKLMREIKFRAKSRDTGEWKHGLLADLYGDTAIQEPSMIYCSVEQETLGQYTGLKDKNGVEIYEGDVMKVEYKDERNFVVEYRPDHAAYVITSKNNLHLMPLDVIVNREGEVIGNVYDNPKLMK